jgi:hypothetical protein
MSIGVGVAMIVAGIVASLVTVAGLEGGGYLFYGLVIAGVLAIVRGVRQR